MADKNIQIMQRNTTNDGWDKVYPQTKAELVIEDSSNRFVTDTEKAAWNSKQDSLSPATTTTEGTMSASDKVKLDGIEAGANFYTHPAAHLPSIITQDSSNRFVTDTEKTTWNNKQDSIQIVATPPTTGTTANQLIFVQV